MKVAFIGSNGFLANSFGKFYNSFDNDIVVYGRTAPKYNSNIFFQLDLLYYDFVIEELLKFDIIYYFAGEGIQSNNKPDVNDIYKINTFIPIELILKLKGKSFSGCFVSFGSYAEIGCNSIIKKFSEEEIINSNLKLLNNYTISKKLLSQFVSNFETPFHLFHFIIPTIYGYYENPNRLIPYIIRNGKEQNL
ncbi:MAG: NAD-dependent epimerase/dehydratase family protein [Saprospiraceae bacterium]|nr:NAD-dependent epimerase/dehydratase family protein [Saprospiraceae bacterium]